METGDKEGFRRRKPGFPASLSGRAARIPSLSSEGLRKLPRDERDREGTVFPRWFTAVEGLWGKSSAPAQNTSSSRSSTSGPSLAAAAVRSPGGEEKRPRKRSQASAISGWVLLVSQASAEACAEGPLPEPIFAAMASGAASRRAFIDSSIQLARANGFSGLDLDWEYPRTASDMSNLGTLLREWRAAVSAEAARTGRPRLLLTAAFYYSSVLNSEEYPAAAVASSLDWINVMSYDYYTPSWRRVTSAHAALYDASSQLSTSAGIGDWTSSGVPSRKIVMGIPFYGYAWRLLNPANNGLGAPATNGATGPGIAADGSIAYNQIRAFIRNNTASRVYDGTTVANYCYAGTTWIGYVDVEAIDDMMTYARDNRLLGYFAWSVSGDENWVLSQRAFSKWA